MKDFAEGGLPEGAVSSPQSGIGHLQLPRRVQNTARARILLTLPPLGLDIDDANLEALPHQLQFTFAHTKERARLSTPAGIYNTLVARPLCIESRRQCS